MPKTSYQRSGLRGDAAVTIDVRGSIPAAGGCELKRDRGIRGGEGAVSRGRLFVACHQRYALRFCESITMSSAAISKATHPRQPMIALLSYENARYFL